MNGFIEESLASTLGRFAIAGILFNVRDHTCIENTLAIACGVKAAIEVEVSSTEIYTDLFGHLFQRFQALGSQHHIGFIDGRHGDRR